jgi:hypothetical protein
MPRPTRPAPEPSAGDPHDTPPVESPGEPPVPYVYPGEDHLHGLTLDDWLARVDLFQRVKDLDRPVSVLRAVALVMLDMPGIQKLTPEQRRKLTGQEAEPGGSRITYAYRGIDQVTTEAQHLFGRHGVVLTWRTLGYEVRAFTMGQNNSPWTEHEMRVEWTVFGPLGDSLKIDTIGLGRDNSDKGSNKALTGAYKNLLLKLLAIGDPKDDPDGVRLENEPGDRRAGPYDDAPAPTAEELEAEKRAEVQGRALADLLPRLSDPQRAAGKAVCDQFKLRGTVSSFIANDLFRHTFIAAINAAAAGDAPTLFDPDAVPAPEPPPPPPASAAEAAAVLHGDAADPDSKILESQNRRIRALYKDVGIVGSDDQLAAARAISGIADLGSHRDLTWQQAADLIASLDGVKSGALELTADDTGKVTGVAIPTEPAEAAPDESSPPEPVDESTPPDPGDP